MAATDLVEGSDTIADQASLQLFSSLPPSERKLTEALRGVLAEIACTGVIRYDWYLLRDLLVHQTEVQLREFEAAEHVEIGPARPLESGDMDIAATIQRFSALLGQFQGPPWTLQRLCELLLEPRKQYLRLHKLALALEKLLLVTGEVGLTPSPPPPPLLTQLKRVNDPPAASAAANVGRLAGQKRSRPEDAEATGLVTAALTITTQPGQQQSATAESAAATPVTSHSTAATEDKEDKENEGAQQAKQLEGSSASGASRQVLQESDEEAAAAGAAGGTAVVIDADAASDTANEQHAAAAAADGRSAAGENTADAVAATHSADGEVQAEQ